MYPSLGTRTQWSNKLDYQKLNRQNTHREDEVFDKSKEFKISSAGRPIWNWETEVR